MKVRKFIRCIGNVQGVGFRYRCQYTAQLLGLTGWVKNEWDGSVEIEAQGEEALIEKLLQKLNNSRYIWIEQMEAKQLPLEEKENNFYIR